MAAASSTPEKGDYKICSSQCARKDTLRCAHIALNIASEGAQGHTPLESWDRGRHSLMKKTHGLGWEGGGQKRKQSSRYRSRPSVSRPHPGRPGRAESGSEGGAEAAWDWGAVPRIQRRQSLGQHRVHKCSSLVNFTFSFKSSIDFSNWAPDLSANSARGSGSWAYPSESLSLPYVCLPFESAFLQKYLDTSGSGLAV